MNILQDKKVAILGFGRHGGGLTSTLFALSQQPHTLSIVDKASESELQDMLQALGEKKSLVNIVPHESHVMKDFDVVIKNPAIPRHANILSQISHIETDISLYYQYQASPTWMVTGTKGKSSVSTALYNILSIQYQKRKDFQANSDVALVGNITNSPLNVLLNKETPQKIILEASSFQLGDLMLVKQAPFAYMELMILTNLMPDHQNYYSSMKEYTADKFLPFRTLSEFPEHHAILPYIPHHTHISEDTVSFQIYDNELALNINQCYFHSTIPLPPMLKGAWEEKDGIHIRHNSKKDARLILEKKHIPSHVPIQNVCILICALISQKELHFNIPSDIKSWERIFQIAHRKEKIAVINSRVFINDSAATIPQAMQLELFKGVSIRLIAGGTDKNLDPKDFIPAVAKVTQLYLLDGSYTAQVIPLLSSHNIMLDSTFKSLESAVHKAFEDSKEGDIIILSPGCASFGMFTHEFDRGDTFKRIVQQLSTRIQS